MNPKVLVALIVIASVILLTGCKPKISGQIAANWQSDANFRVVDGQIYDTEHSELWKSPVEAAGFYPHRNENFRLLTYQAKVETVEWNKIQCGVYEQAHWPPVPNGDVESDELVQEIVIYHYPNAESLVSGQDLGKCRCMRVANYISGGVSLIALDCGVPYSKPVPMFDGVHVKVAGVRVLLVDPKEAENYLQKKESEAHQQRRRVGIAVGKLQAQLNDPHLSYTNDPRYVMMIDESNKDERTVETLSNAVVFLRSKYGPSPYSMNMLLFRRYPQEYYDAWHAEDVDEARIASIRFTMFRREQEADSLIRRIEAEKQQQIQVVLEKLEAANESLKPLQTPHFYLADFSPTPLETSVTDRKGSFVFHNPPKGTMIFAKVKSNDTGREFFWLINLPPEGKKLILNIDNLFTAPTNFP